MKKYIELLLILIFFSTLNAAKEIKNYTHSFFGVYGKKASVMGKVDGSAFEVWIYPYKVLHDMRFQVLVEGVEENPYTRLGSYRYMQTCFEREFIGEKWVITEQLYPAHREPVVYLVYRVRALTDITLEFVFKPDLSPMWPAAIGGKYSYYEEEENAFVLSESTSKNVAFFGGFPGKKVGELPAHHLPGGMLKYRVPVAKGTSEIPLAAVAGQGKYEDFSAYFREMKEKHTPVLKEREEQLKTFLSGHLKVRTPEEWINEALQWAMLNVNAAFVDNPDLGEGLIAGYGLSGERERPGFGWYFGGDGLINSFAVLNYGDFAGARRELEFLLKYQRKDGKIMHELSQGAKFVDWFGAYGFPYFHGDTTLYFAVFLDFYVKRTGDSDFCVQNREKLDKVFSWMEACDGEPDGIMEARLAGVGASETGPLRQAMKTDIYLAALSQKAWEAMENIYTVLQDDTKAAFARQRKQRAGQALDLLFWDKDTRYYWYAVKEDGTPVKEITIWPAVAMRFKVLSDEKGRAAQRKIAAPELSADWGTRFLSSASGYYDPSSYNNGAVWPFLTGFSSLALYNYGNPYHGYSLLRANLGIIGDFDFGAPTELLSGDIYRPLDQSVPNQTWSSGNTISAFIQGLAGFEADAVKKEIRLTPAIPLSWPYVQLDNLKAGKGTVGIDYKKEKNRQTYRLDLVELEGYTLEFAPELPVLRSIVTVDGERVVLPAAVKIRQATQQTVIAIDLFNYVYPYIQRELNYGDFSRGPIIEDFRQRGSSFTLDLWGRGETDIYFITDSDIHFSEGSARQEEGRSVLSLKFSDHWEQKSIWGKIKEIPSLVTQE